MWQMVKHNVQEGTFEVLKDGSDLADENSVAALDGNTYIFPAGSPPADVQEQNSIIQRVFQINGGRVIRASVGVKLQDPEKIEGLSSCPGRCFCVIDGGSRRCETYYCNGNGYCWWVPCNMGC